MLVINGESFPLVSRSDVLRDGAFSDSKPSSVCRGNGRKKYSFKTAA